MRDEQSNVVYFKDQAALRQWFEENHQQKDELWVGYYKKSSGLPSVDWSQSVDQALCFGWIDGIRKSIDEMRYKIRFTPRRPNSHWSRVNIDKIKTLNQNGFMKPEGLAAFKKRKPERTARASHEQTNIIMPPAFAQQMETHPVAIKYFRSQPPSYVKACTHWVMSAKKEETRIRRLEILISCCDKQEKLPQYQWSKKNK